MHDITKPLQLAIGSHAAGSGYGCAMNVISWEQGDTEITDFPACSDEYLAALVQEINDSICEHTPIPSDDDEPRLLCPKCSMRVLGLGHRTVGTNLGVHGRKVFLEMIQAGAIKYREEFLPEKLMHSIFPEYRQALTDFWDKLIEFIDIAYTLNERQMANARMATLKYGKAKHLAKMYELAETFKKLPAVQVNEQNALYAVLGILEENRYNAENIWEFLSFMNDINPDDRLALADWVLNEFDRRTGWTAPVVPDEVVAEAYAKLSVKV